MRLSLVLSVLMGLVVAVVSPVHAVAPREPLTFQHVGVYGGWDDYLVSKDNPFDYLIIQANVVDGKLWWHTEKAQREAGDNRTWNEWLKIARANGKRIIADVGAGITVDGHEYHFQSLYNEENPLPIEKLFPMFDAFFEQVDEEELYAITIGEEHVFWNGQQERIVAVTEYLKSKYDVPMYHWWSPSHAGSRVGVSWPNLPGDGWMLDEYFLTQPNIEASLRAHTALQKPVFQIIWAAPEMPSCPWDPRTFWDQFMACRKYNVPIAFFAWHGRDESPHTDTWGWDANASPKARQVWEDFCLHAAELAGTLPAISQEEWDFAPYGQKAISLAAKEGVDAIGVYGETFAKPREVLFLDDARIEGFRHLKWDSSPVQLQPRESGPAELKLIYTIDCPADAKSLVVEAAGSGDVQVEVTDLLHQSLGEGALKDGKATATIDIGTRESKRYIVTFSLKGTAKEAGQVLAEMSEISIKALK